MFKKIVSVFAVFSLIFCFASCKNRKALNAPLEASDFIKSGIDEITNFKYDEYEDYIIVTGIKTNPDNINIPAKINKKDVKAIEKNAFSDMGWLNSISMPDTIVEIRENAFFGCTNVDKISFSANLYSIGTSAFYGNKYVDSIRLPLGISIVGAYAFADCARLKNVIVPDSAVSVGGGAFINTPWLNSQKDEFVTVGNKILIDYNGNAKSVTIPNDIIEVSAFCDNLTIESVVFGESVQRIGDHGFANSPLKTVSLPKNVISVGENAFDGCLELSSVSLNEKLEKIGAYAFMGCQKITEMQVPEKVVSIGDGAFKMCDKLTKITIISDKTSIGNDICENCMKKLTIACPAKSPAVKYAQNSGFVLDVI